MIKIITEKVMVGSKKFRRITSIKMLKEKELPIEYLNKPPCVFLNSAGIIAIRTNAQPLFSLFTIDLPITEDFFQAFLIHLHKCGDRLQRINKQIEKDKWSGTETINI